MSMKGIELLRLVWLNINQNRFKSIMTSIGIVVGAATIVMVIGIGRGGQMDIADQFAELNAGAIDISYDYAGEEDTAADASFFGNMMSLFGNMNRTPSTGNESRSENRSESRTGSRPGNSEMQAAAGEAGFGRDFQNGENNLKGADNKNTDSAGRADKDIGSGETGSDNGKMENKKRETKEKETNENEMPVKEEMDKEAGSEETDGETDEEQADDSSIIDERLNQEQIILNEEDVDDIETYIADISGATISYYTKTSVEGGNLTDAQTYTVAGVKENFASLSKLQMEEGYFLDRTDDEGRSRVCVLGATIAKELFDTASDAVDHIIYIDDRSYTIQGVLSSSNTVASGISPDSAIFIPYETGIKYITGENIDPTITVVTEDVNGLQSVIENVKTVLQENYPNTSFTFKDSGSKMQAAEASNRTLTILLSAMAAIVFFVGGIGIMNVLFVSVKERTNEIGILKAIGTAQSDILLEFLIEAAAISLMGGILGVIFSLGIVPVVSYFGVRVEVGPMACLTALGFAVLTGTVFGIYPAWKASRLEPVEALTTE